MFDVSPGWHTSLQPLYYLTGNLLSVLASIMLVWFISVKVFKIKKENYQKPINITNLIFCILSSVLLLSYFFELAVAWYSGYFYEQFSFLSRSVGPYWLLYLGLTWVPLLLTQFFWRKTNRVNINLALVILIMFNLHLWFEKIYVFIISLLRP